MDKFLEQLLTFYQIAKKKFYTFEGLLLTILIPIVTYYWVTTTIGTGLASFP